MTESVGIDLVEVKRIQKAAERSGERFMKRIFTERERAYCQKKGNEYGSLAARFAAKEAVFKALGTGWSMGAKWTDIEVINDALGKPEVVLHGKIKELVGTKHVAISLTHTREYAQAVAVLGKQ
ncbi:MAG: holo-[acyl-carrier-protein] synthase [Candidatus Latescibacteria bacterium 4484_107]|nr:MAG: holo-[acyl-carrier-protein] synthase [Candidatus Latescibacteria bacterium 4484_107]